MKAELDPAIHFMRGSAGSFVYRKIRGKTIMSERPRSDREATPGQMAHRERFKQAAFYGKVTMGNEEVRALYEEAAKDKDLPIFSVMVADFFNAPIIHSIDLSGYNGMANSTIIIYASDDFSVNEVQVIVSDEQGAHLESGGAQETVPGAGQWVYIAKSTPLASTLVVKAVAKDRPGNVAVKTETLVREQG